jgi:hypothetical protein
MDIAAEANGRRIGNNNNSSNPKKNQKVDDYDSNEIV